MAVNEGNLTDDEAAELLRLEAIFEELGGRGVELAERIDTLRRKRDAEPYELIVRITVPDKSQEWAITDALNETLNALAYDGLIDDSDDDAWCYDGLRR